jgi:hypothetical protein
VSRTTAHALTFALAFGLVAAGCGELKDLPTAPGGGNEPPDPTATFSRVQSEIFTPTCARVGCHDAFGAQQGLVLAAGSAYGHLVNVKSTENALDRVEPGSPQASYLYLKITGSAGITGERMPFGLAPLDDAQLKLVSDWIRRGAPND